jgi:hypothetical protein
MMVTIDCGVLAGIFNPHAGSSHSSVGLTAEELLEFAYIAGAHPNVSSNLIPDLSFIDAVLISSCSHVLSTFLRLRRWRCSK